MSKISEQLRKYAQEEKQAHQEYIKDFSTATIFHLVDGGVDKDKAFTLAKEACLRDPELIKSVTRATILEKTAQYIETVEEENIQLKAKLGDFEGQEKQAGEKRPAHLEKLAALGFSDEEIDAMKEVPSQVIEKVANVSEQVWEMGRPSGRTTDNSDPLLQWILS